MNRRVTARIGPGRRGITPRWRPRLRQGSKRPIRSRWLCYRESRRESTKPNGWTRPLMRGRFPARPAIAAMRFRTPSGRSRMWSVFMFMKAWTAPSRGGRAPSKLCSTRCVPFLKSGKAAAPDFLMPANKSIGIPKATSISSVRFQRNAARRGGFSSSRAHLLPGFARSVLWMPRNSRLSRCELTSPCYPGPFR